VSFKQGPRRCLILDTVDGLSSEEALWTALASWARFQPRLSKPRKFPGRLFYLNEATHIFAECWNHLDDLSSSPGFSGKSPICQAAMLAFSEGLSKLVHESWAPQPTAESPMTQRFPGCARLRTARTSGTCTGVVSLQPGLPRRVSHCRSRVRPRLRVNGYVCGSLSPSLCLRRFFPLRGFRGADSVLLGDRRQGSLDITMAGCNWIARLPPEVVGPSRGAI
jgi:hypothetical protein